MDASFQDNLYRNDCRNLYKVYKSSLDVTEVAIEKMDDFIIEFNPTLIRPVPNYLPLQPFRRDVVFTYVRMFIR
jgi:hypothetical protein